MKTLCTILLFTVCFCSTVSSFSLVLAAGTRTSTRATGTALKALGKKSTALDVLEYLNKNNKLASYINLESSSEQPVAIVTGGSSGIGIPSVETLALANMKVVLCARNLQAANDVVESLPSTLRKNVRVQKLDLADMNSIKSAAEEIIEKEGKIDVLLNNAGVMAPPKREATAQDLELQFGTNHVGHHMFTRLLLPTVNEGGRIVTVASTAHSFGQLNFQNLNFDSDGSKEERGYSSWGAYGQSKLANILFAKGLSDELKAADVNSSIKCVSLHPGVIGTNLWRYSPKWIKPFLNALVTDKNVEQGAATNVFCCLVEGDEFEGGEYLSDCTITEPKTSGKDEAGSLRKKLWRATEKLIENNGFHLPSPIRQLDQ
jgi:NAD(P)-dependent dehydrogenase (short-subunit alcohol dehydrogenase family)